MSGREGDGKVQMFVRMTHRGGLWGTLLGIALTLAAAAQPAPSTQPTDTQRRAAAELEMANLASQLEICAAQIDFYVALEALNDLTFSQTTYPYDYINQGGGCWVMRPTQGLFLSSRVDLINRFNDWGGPYVTYQDGTTQLETTPYDQGSPLDPWGFPYLFYSPLGLVRGDSGSVTLEYHGDLFDRYAIVSLGPDGQVSSDDVARVFGSGVTSFVISGVNQTAPDTLDTDRRAQSASPGSLTAQAGQPATLRGYNLGAVQDGAQVMFGAVDLSSAVTSWSATAIGLDLPADLTGTAALTVQRGAATTNALQITLTPRPVKASRAWVLFE